MPTAWVPSLLPTELPQRRNYSIPLPQVKECNFKSHMDTRLPISWVLPSPSSTWFGPWYSGEPTYSQRHHFDKYGLIDVWCTSNPTAREFTYYSDMHNIYTQIDYLICSPNLSSCRLSASIIPNIWSIRAYVQLNGSALLSDRKDPSWSLSWYFLICWLLWSQFWLWCSSTCCVGCL